MTYLLQFHSLVQVVFVETPAFSHITYNAAKARRIWEYLSKYRSTSLPNDHTLHTHIPTKYFQWGEVVYVHSDTVWPIPENLPLWIAEKLGTAVVI